MIKTLTVYNSALCNLNCRYCFISKNPALKIIDEKLEASFTDTNYYPSFIQKMEENGIEMDIDRLEIWGGEPTLSLNRIFPFIEYLINKYPNFKTIKFSSNYNSPKVRTCFKELNELLARYSPREFIIESQISLDGPPEITDPARGDKVTETLLHNFYYLAANNYFAVGNTKVYLYFKATLDIDSMKFFLDKANIIRYYEWCEDNIISVFYKYNPPSVTLRAYPFPNIADPAPHTVEDGKAFARIIQNLFDVSKEHTFKYYKNIILYKRQNHLDIPKEGFSFCGGFCNSGVSMVGLLPDYQFCNCHRAFADYAEEYRKNYELNNGQKKIIENNFGSYPLIDKQIISKNFFEFRNYQEKVKEYYNRDNKTVIFSLISQIQSLARIGQVEEKYKDINKARTAAYEFLRLAHGCYYSNASLTGSASLFYTGVLKLFLNGALSVFEQEGVFNSK